MELPAKLDTQDAEVTRVSKSGFWVSLPEEEVYLPFEHFPWFRDAPLGKLLNVQHPTSHHIYWPDLDIDLELESIVYPEPSGPTANDGVWRIVE